MIPLPSTSLGFSDSKGQLGVLFAAAKTRMLLEACMSQVVPQPHHQITANTQNQPEAASWRSTNSSVYMAAYIWQCMSSSIYMAACMYMHAQVVELCVCSGLVLLWLHACHCNRPVTSSTRFAQKLQNLAEHNDKTVPLVEAT